MEEISRNKNQEFSDILDQIGRELDITESQFEAAVKSYNAVGTWLCKEGSLLAPYSPEILPQGSFMLGTMVKPINDKDDIDIDLVCQLQGKRWNWTQKDLKQVVGERIKEHDTYKKMLDSEGRRCWTLIYSDDANYHMDILPSVGASNYKIILEKAFSQEGIQNVDDLAIRITDKEKDDYHTETNINNWLKSNPFGYGKWFFGRATIEISEKRMLSASIKPVPNYQRNKLPLQRVVQLLKRHRDLMFEGDENKPISIIITTLATRAYGKERDVLSALNNIINGMGAYIETKWSPEHNKYIKWVTNPVNSEENFADKWPMNPQLEKNFYDWLEKVNRDIQDFTSHKGIHLIGEAMSKSFGKRIVSKAITNVADLKLSQRESGNLKMARGTGVLGAIGTKVKNHTFYGKK